MASVYDCGSLSDRAENALVDFARAEPALVDSPVTILAPAAGASMIVSSYPASDLGEAGVTGLRYCGDGDRDVSGASATLSGASSECWESCPEAGGHVAGIGRGAAVPLGSVYTTCQALGVTGGLSWSGWSSEITSSIVGSSGRRFPKPFSLNLTFKPITIFCWRPSHSRHYFVVYVTYPRSEQREAFGFSFVPWASGTCR